MSNQGSSDERQSEDENLKSDDDFDSDDDVSDKTYDPSKEKENEKAE